MANVIIDAFYQAPEAMMITNQDGDILHVNDAFTTISGYSEEEVQGKNPRFLQSGRHDKLFYQNFWKELQLVGQWFGEIWNRSKDGTIYSQWVSISSLRDIGGNVRNFVAVMSDAKIRKDESQRIARLENLDSLTGLPNRALFMDRLTGVCARALRNHDDAALLLINLDHLSLVNDALGHDAGDRLLSQTVGRLLGCVRDTDTVARIAGDEFAIILAKLTEMKDVEVVARKILTELGKPFELGDQAPTFISASIGIALLPLDGKTAEELVKFSDMAKYQSKRDGGNVYRFYSEDMNTDVVLRMEYIRSINHALINDELDVYYLPIIDSGNGLLVGAEALLRWNRPDGKTIPAAEFVSIAEDAGLMVRIGETVLDKVVNALVSWRDKIPSPVRISINLSPQQLRNPKAFDSIRERLEAAEIDPTLLEFEISEGILKDDSPKIREALKQLSSFGIGLAVDNFGTGYTSLQHLRNVPVQVMKIDKLFVRTLQSGGEDALLTEAMIAMAHSLGIRVVAEGIETPEQWQMMQGRACDFGQGYLFSNPLSKDEFLDFACNYDGTKPSLPLPDKNLSE
ncbi:MAG TPA: EAL domain-containing protein [Rhodospirillaceae bacterium]|nr:EAL domain-containing protein [Rhodospirillaceae bacterium]